MICARWLLIPAFVTLIAALQACGSDAENPRDTLRAEACDNLVACGIAGDSDVCLTDPALDSRAYCVWQCIRESACEDIAACHDPNSESFATFCLVPEDGDGTSIGF